jgi:hypothetical protein
MPLSGGDVPNPRMKIAIELEFPHEWPRERRALEPLECAAETQGVGLLAQSANAEGDVFLQRDA